MTETTKAMQAWAKETGIALPITKRYEDGLRDAARICAEAAICLLSNGVDRHTAEVLRSMERKILSLGDVPPS